MAKKNKKKQEIIVEEEKAFVDDWRLESEPEQEEPEPTEEPEAVEESAPTEEPEAVEEPEPTEEPEAVEESAPTEEPETVEEPEPTEEPEAVEDSAPTEESEIVKEPEVTEEPELIEKPEKKKEATEPKKAKKKVAKKISKTNAGTQVKKSREVKADKEIKEPEKTSVGDIIRLLIFCTALGVFAFSASGLAVIMWGYYSSQQEYKDIQGGVQIGEADPGKPAEKETTIDEQGQVVEIERPISEAPYIPIKVDSEYYKTVNPDYAMYIYIPGTNINYPVVQSPDRNYYLRYTFKKTENTAGAISIDYRTDRSKYLEEFNIIISGHNRQDGTMFSELTQYNEKSFRDKNPYIYIVMDDKEYVYEVFAASLMDPVSVLYNVYTPAATYIEEIKKVSSYVSENVTENDKIITLYTCNEDSSKRYIAHAVLRKIYDNK